MPYAFRRRPFFDIPLRKIAMAGTGGGVKERGSIPTPLKDTKGIRGGF
jgi:hypothetical protein